MFADRVAFVDLETTGMSPLNCAITEIGVVLVCRNEDRLDVTEWSSLVNPQRPIPPEIQFLTGISNAMVAEAPSFAELAPTLAELLQDAVFVAHHVRFDYGFVKQAFAEIGVAFTEKTLCTVRLSKLLDPDRSPHSLDALIHRHKLGEDDRHRALGDARLIYRYLTKMYAQRGAEVVEPAVRRLLRQPSLPAHLPADALTNIPNSPGIYRFLGVNDQPLYIGKSIHLRERVASHFVNDHRSERGVRLSSEIRRIDWQLTAGDFGAQLLEQQQIRARQPSHNAALRRKENQMVLAPLQPITAAEGKKSSKKLLQWHRASELAAAELPGHFGPFGSKASARHWLSERAPQAGICLGVLGIERIAPGSPCFNRQLGRCRGCCIGLEPVQDMLDRVNELLAPLLIPPWPYPGGLLCLETAGIRQATFGAESPSQIKPDSQSKSPASSPIQEWHAFDDWCYLGSAGSEAEARDLLTRAERTFDNDSYRLLARALATQVPASDSAQVPAPDSAQIPASDSTPIQDPDATAPSPPIDVRRSPINEWNLQFMAPGRRTAPDAAS